MAAAILLGLIMIYNSLPEGKSDSSKFSADNAYSYLENIAKDPHSVFDTEQLDNVRQYIMDTITGFGMTPELVRHNPVQEFNAKTNAEETVEIDNIYTELPGTSGQNILLMAHYDSSPYKLKYGEVTQGSHGAADDGYGVATLLEVMRLIKSSDEPLVNGIKFVFTDSEETDLYGAKAVTNENSGYLKDVNLVVNVEARGNHGPLYMFQTSAYNTKIIDLYSRVDRPFSYSVAAEVYKYLPSDTDLTPFLNAGYNCINFSTLNDLRSYHTQNDILENTSKNALMDYGSQVYPLVTEYVYHKAYSSPGSFDSTSDSVFFAFLPGILVHYPVSVSWVIIGITLLVALFAVVLAYRKKLLGIASAAKSFVLWLVFLIAAAVAGYLAVWLPCLITGNAFHLTFMPYVPFDRGFLVLSAILISVGAVGYVRLQMKLKTKLTEVLTGGLFLNIVMLLVFALVLHGGTYLFVWPVLLTALYLISGLLLSGSRKESSLLQQLLRGLLILYIVLMFFLLVYSLFLALTIGALAVMLLLLSIPLSILAPMLLFNDRKTVK
jgi:hypothetical protein